MVRRYLSVGWMTSSVYPWATVFVEKARSKATFWWLTVNPRPRLGPSALCIPGTQQARRLSSAVSMRAGGRGGTEGEGARRQRHVTRLTIVVNVGSVATLYCLCTWASLHPGSSTVG